MTSPRRRPFRCRKRARRPATVRPATPASPSFARPLVMTTANALTARFATSPLARTVALARPNDKASRLEPLHHPPARRRRAQHLLFGFVVETLALGRI